MQRRGAFPARDPPYTLVMFCFVNFLHAASNPRTAPLSLFDEIHPLGALPATFVRTYNGWAGGVQYLERCFPPWVCSSVCCIVQLLDAYLPSIIPFLQMDQLAFNIANNATKRDTAYPISPRVSSRLLIALRLLCFQFLLGHVCCLPSFLPQRLDSIFEHLLDLLSVTLIKVDVLFSCKIFQEQITKG